MTEMKYEKDPRINVSAFRKSLKLYLFMFLLFGLLNFFQTHLFLILAKNNLFNAGISVDTILKTLEFIEQEALAPKEFFRRYTILSMLFIAAFTAVLTVIFGVIRHFSLTRPLGNLGAAARKVAKGDFSVRVAPRLLRKNKKKDSMDILFEDFNTMTEELAEANEKLKALSITDELTKLNNRRAFLEYINLIWKQNHRLNLPVTVLVIDVDHFKKYNDTLGHLEGDKALIAIAQCLKNNLKRETDFAARLGGEEFVYLLPFIGNDDALKFANSLVRKVEEMKIPHPASEQSEYITISAGMAAAIPNDSNSPTLLLEEADKALYEAKKAGRNRVVAM
jgi:diguanylate cyclase (GGDEF)-like protein